MRLREWLQWPSTRQRLTDEAAREARHHATDRALRARETAIAQWEAAHRTCGACQQTVTMWRTYADDSVCCLRCSDAR